MSGTSSTLALTESYLLKQRLLSAEQYSPTRGNWTTISGWSGAKEEADDFCR